MFIQELEPSLQTNPKRFWSFVKSKTGGSSIPDTVKWNMENAENCNDKANLYNRYFHSVFNKTADNADNFDRNEQISQQILSDIHINDDDVLKILLELDVNKAMGPDKISPILLKYFAQEITPSLSSMIRMSLENGTVPNDWLKANVVPIHKSGSKECVENYRPISLLSIVSKICERCIHNHMYSHVISQLNNNQYGFLKGKSTCSQMLNFTDELGKSLDCSSQTDVIYLDFSKAFDSVSHNYLLYKLKLFGIAGNLLKWLESYLLNRFQRVVVAGGTSDWLPVNSGVPQGSILGPLLFCIFVDDMSQVVKSSKILLYADDTKCYSKIDSVADCINLQNDLDLLYNWSCKWNLKFNAKKCKILSICRSKNPVHFYYNINGQILEKVQNIRDLGVIVDSDLKWSNHISNIVAKANQMSYLVKRTVGYTAPINVKKQLFISMVRSNIEYCSQVWGGANRNDIIKLERIQRSATKYILGYPDNMNYNERLCELNLTPLSYRREMSDLIFFFKCLNNMHEVNVLSYVQFTSDNACNTRSTVEELRLCVPNCHTESYKKLYYNRIVQIWNSLPVNVRKAQTITNFRTNIQNIYNEYFMSNFDSDNVCTWTLKCNCVRCRFY